MNVIITIPKDARIFDIMRFVNEIDKYVIDYEIIMSELTIKILTTPMNKPAIKRIAERYSKMLQMQRSKVGESNEKVYNTKI